MRPGRRRAQQVEHDQAAPASRRQAWHAALGGMQAHLQRIERQRLADRDDQLAVEREARSGSAAEGRDDLREIAGQPLARPGHSTRPCRRRDGEAAKAVPLRLELPALVARQLVDLPRFHRGPRHGLSHRSATTKVHGRCSNLNIQKALVTKLPRSSPCEARPSTKCATTSISPTPTRRSPSRSTTPRRRLDCVLSRTGQDVRQRAVVRRRRRHFRRSHCRRRRRHLISRASRPTP